MSFEEETAEVSSTEDVFREGFLVISCLYVAIEREESREDPRTVGRARRGEGDSFLRCMFVVGSAG